MKPAHEGPTPEEKPTLDQSWLAIVTHWRIVVAELMRQGVDLYDPAVRSRPWPGVRTLIFSLLDEPSSPLDPPSRLREALTRR